MTDTESTGGADPQSSAPDEAAGSLPEHLPRRVLESGAAQLGGRVLITLARLGAASLIVRTFGVERFGEYALILSLLWISDWIVDFGMSDIAAREICRRPKDRVELLGMLAASKGIQVLVAYPLLIGLLVALQYPSYMVMAGSIAGLETIFYGGVLVYRAQFKANVTLQWDVASELGGALALLPMLFVACRYEAGLPALLGCFVASRGVSFAMAYGVGRRLFPLRLSLGPPGALRASYWETLPLGIHGLFAALYSSLDVMMLSKLGTLRDLGLYSGAQRLVFPVMVMVSSLGAILFPILAATWARRKEDFRNYLQLGLDAVVVVAGAVVITFIASSRAFLGLLGPDMEVASPILDILAVAVFFKAIGSVVGSVLVVVGKQVHAVWVSTLGLVVKVGLLAYLVPAFGMKGAAYGYLAVELLVGFFITVLLAQRFAGRRFHWGSALKVLGIAALVLVGLDALGLRGGVLAGVLALAAFAACALLTRAVRPAHLSGLRAGMRSQSDAETPTS